MMQIVNGSEMSLAKQYFVDWLVAIKQQHRSFSGTERKIQITANKDFSVTRGSNISSIRTDSYILAERFCQQQVENYFGR